MPGEEGGGTSIGQDQPLTQGQLKRRTEHHTDYQWCHGEALAAHHEPHHTGATHDQQIGKRILAGPAGGSGVAEDVAAYTRRYRCKPGERWVDIEPEPESITTEDSLEGNEKDEPQASTSSDTTVEATGWRPTPRKCSAS